MTNEQAIKWLKDYIQNTPFQMEQYERAFDMAIQSLSQEATDIVSRGAFEQVMRAFDIAVGQLKELGYGLGQKIEPCDDAISREAILSKIKEVCFSKEWTQFRVDNGSHGQRDFLINYIEQLPSVTHKSGKWEFHCQHWSKCSICGYADKFADKWNYCPNCGAKMENVEKSLLDIKAESEE